MIARAGIFDYCRFAGFHLCAGQHSTIAQGILVRIVFVVRVKMGPEQGRSDQDHDVTGTLQNQPRCGVLLNAS